MSISEGLISLLLLALVHSGSTQSTDCKLCSSNPHRPLTPVAATDFLRRYGYLKDGCFFNPGKTSYKNSVLEAIINFQEFNNLKVTGQLDKETLDLMGSERCGVADILEEVKVTIISSRRRGKRQSQVTSRRWRKTNLTYLINEYSDDLSPGMVDGIIRDAWKVWSDVTPLTFTQVDASRYDADMEISFVRGVHGDTDPFDGPGGVVAHAFYPGPSTMPLSGDTHFDDDEVWTIGEEQMGRRLFCVAVHEFGHVLGLEHTNRKDSIMYPWKRECGNGSLSDYDMIRIQSIYGPNPNTGLTPSPNVTMTTLTLQNMTSPRIAMTSPTTRVTPEPTTNTEEPVCTTIVQNTCATTVAITTTTTATTTIGTTTTEQVTTTSQPSTTMTPQPTTNGTRPGPATNGTTGTDGCPPDGKLDAIDVCSDGNTYAFKGKYVYQLTTKSIVYGYPKLITEVFPHAPESVDAVVTIRTHHIFIKKVRTYIFKDDRVWKYTFESHWGKPKFMLKKGYPKLIKEKFGIVVKKIDAAFNLKSSKRIYLVEGTKLWEVKFRSFGGPKVYKPIPFHLHPTLKHLKGVDAAIKYKSYAYYFFKGDYYYRLLPVGSKGQWSYPKHTLLWWFDCKVPGHEKTQRPAGESKDSKYAAVLDLGNL